MKQFFSLIGYAILFLVLIVLAISWDIYRWHAFQDVTNSDISYLKWHFVFNSGRR
jgi:hypothetical protein